MTPMPANRALDHYFLEARCRVLDLAAILDRIGRGSGTVQSDARIDQLKRAVHSLLDLDANRAERVQEVFSLPYDPSWKRPQPQ